MTLNKKILPLKFFLSFGFIFLSIFIIVYADIFPKTEETMNILPAFVGYDEGNTSDIVMDNVVIDVSEEQDIGVLQYVVQNGDSLGKIASMFGTTVSNIQKVNKLNNAIRPGQKLVITNDEDGFLYTISDNINVKIFASQYGINLDELMTLNYIQDESEILYKGQDIFINIDKEKAYDNGLLDRPQPVIVIKPTTAYKPVINKPSTYKKPSTNSQFVGDDTDASSTSSSKSKIISQWVFKKDIKNQFYAGYCTWYAAIITPEIFKYTSENKQERPFGGNAREWCENAKKAGFSVGSKPAAGALIVYTKGGRLTYAGHVGKVINYYADEGKMIIRDMNRIAKFVVTERREETSNKNIKCYIYPSKAK